MKNIIYLILLFAIIVGFDSPTTEREYITDEIVDKRFLDLINEYRAYYKLPSFKWNSVAYKMAKHHTEYQYQIKTVTHYEIDSVKSLIALKSFNGKVNYLDSNEFNKLFKQEGDYPEGIKKSVSMEKVNPTGIVILEKPIDRADYFALKSINMAECVVGGLMTLELAPNFDYAKFVKKVFNKDVLECNPIDRILYESIWKWENSPKHKEILIGNFNEGALSIKYVMPEVFEKSIFHEGRPTQRDRFFATLITVLN